MNCAPSPAQCPRALFLASALLLFAFAAGADAANPRHLTLPFATQQTQAPSDRDRASELLRQGKHTEALPFLERAVAGAPQDGELQFWLGYTRFVAAKDIKDEVARRKARVQARDSFVLAKRYGYASPLLDSALASIPLDGSDPVRFSPNPKVEAAMGEGEAAYSRGDFDSARKAYQRALDLDPTQYYAALFIGDSYFKEGYSKPKGIEQTSAYAQAGEWFTRAVKINPSIETAHRYWGSALMESGKMGEALDKVVEAYIVAPYDRMASQGLVRWAQMNGVSQLSHPRIEIPANVARQGANTTLTLDPNTLGKDATDGSNHWLTYGISRAAYPQALFAKDHPNETTYRHSLAEEARALRMVAEAASKDLQAGKIKQLEPSLANLVKLHNEGLLEAYVLLGRADAGIAQDYSAYRQANADKLRRYVRQYIMQRSN